MKTIRSIIFSRTFSFLFALLIGSLIFFIRNPVNFILPNIYAEDGSWTSLIYNYGIIYALRFARPDYYVVGNIMALWLGIKCCALFCSDSIAYLPKCYALVSYFWYALVVALPIVLLKNYLKRPFLCVLWLALCFMPLGYYTASEMEILGRLSNIGYSFLYLGFILTLYRFNGAKKYCDFLIVDILLVVCAATNPICFVYLIPLLCSTIYDFKNRTYIKLTKKQLITTFIILSLFFFVSLKILLNPQKKDIISIGLSFQKIIEIGLTRNILNPIVFPFYPQYNIASPFYSHHGVILSIAVAGVTAFLFFYYSNKRDMYVFLFGLGVLIITSIVLIKIRPDLRNYAIDFKSTYPDRYYYGQNMISITLLVFLIQSIFLAKKRLLFRIILAVIGVAFLFSPIILECPIPTPNAEFEPIAKGFLFTDCLEKAIEDKVYVNKDGTANPKGSFLKIEVFCEGWSMILPVNKVITQK